MLSYDLQRRLVSRDLGNISIRGEEVPLLYSPVGFDLPSCKMKMILLDELGERGSTHNWRCKGEYGQCQGDDRRDMEQRVDMLSRRSEGLVIEEICILMRMVDDGKDEYGQRREEQRD